MNIIVGASGQVGSCVIKELNQKGQQARGVVRDSRKAETLGVDVVVADLLDADQVANAFNGGTTAFIITPEDPASKDILGQTKQIIENYRKAIQSTGIRKVVGLSCVGAHVHKGTGNILMSRMLEQSFDDLDIERIFIRPSYYYSNWLVFLEPADQHGVLPTFFPGQLKFDMNSPIDLAGLISDSIINPIGSRKKVIEVAGPEQYCVEDVASIFSRLLGKNIALQEIPAGERIKNLRDAGYSLDGAQNLSDMTQAVIDEVAMPERPVDLVRLTTTLEEYLRQEIGEPMRNNR